MTSIPIISRLRRWVQRRSAGGQRNLHELARQPELLLDFVRHSAVAMCFLKNRPLSSAKWPG